MAQKPTAWIARLTLATIAATTIVSGQTQKPAQTPQSPQTPQRQPETVFRATANNITETLLARDAKGQFVPDLRADEVQVFEDGVLQKISVFLPVIGGRPMGSVATAPPPAASGGGLILPRTIPPPDASGRIFIVFIDDLHLQASMTPKTKDLLKQIRDTLVKDSDLVGFVSSGYSSIASDIQYDYKHKRFDEAIKKTMGGGQTTDEIIKAPDGQDGPAGTRYLAHVAFGTANDILQQAIKITNRRKSFLYISSGYDFNPFKDSRLKYQQDQYAVPDKSNTSAEQSTDAHNYNDPFSKQGQQFAEADLVAELAELIRTANRASVSFYTIDPRGLMSMMDIDQNLTWEEWNDNIRETVTSLQVLGEQTGGFCICQSNKFKEGLARIDAETSDYYTIGYNSTNPDPLKYVRKIEIKITRPGVKAEGYRDTYTLPRANKKGK